MGHALPGMLGPDGSVFLGRSLGANSSGDVDAQAGTVGDAEAIDLVVERFGGE